MEGALAMLGIGAATIGGIIGWHLHGLKRNLTNRQLTYDMNEMTARTNVLEERIDRALKSERDAIEARGVLEREQGVWAKRLLVMRSELEARR